MVTKRKGEPAMDAHFSLFNCHVNGAKEKANRSFIQKFGQEKFDKEIQPFHEDGIMGIFDKKPTKYTRFYVLAVFCFVNEHATLEQE